MIKFEIFSDPICPWCFIAKTWFDRARETYPEQEFEVIWKPFQLNPKMPNSGMDRSVYLNQKFGGRQQAIEAYRPIVNTAMEQNIKINFESIKRTPNTLDAHRLIHWSQFEGIQDKMVSGLFRAYFQDGVDIGKKEPLIEISSASGLNEELTSRLLSSDQDKKLIADLDHNARKMGISGVPMFIIDETYAISGAQKVEFWKKVFLEIKQNLSPNL